MHHQSNVASMRQELIDHTLSRHDKPDGRIRRILLAKTRSVWLGSESPEVHQKSVFLTQRVHLFPFRTQKLSFAVPTILAWRRAGKISHSRQRRIKYSGISKRDSRRTEKSGKPISPEMRRRRHSLKTVRRATLAFLIALYPTFLLSSCRSIPTEHGVIFIPP